MDENENAAGSNVLDFAGWNERLREQRALEEARKASEEREQRMRLLLQAFRC
jgi:hypothetical protein